MGSPRARLGDMAMRQMSHSFVSERAENEGKKGGCEEPLSFREAEHQHALPICGFNILAMVAYVPIPCLG